MASEIGGLLINLGMDVASMKRDVGKATRELSSFRAKVDRQMGKVQRSFKKAASGLKGLVAVVGISRLAGQINQVVQATNRLGKAANTADLTAESLQELRFAFGQLADVTDKQVDTALQKYTRRIGLAKDGTGAAKDTFDEIGVSITDATGKLRDSEPVLDDVLRALGSMESDALRAAKASEIFGEEVGPKLAAALKGGIDNMDNARKKANELGIVLSDDLVQGAEDAADKLDILNKRMQRQNQELIVENIEHIEAAAEAWGEFKIAVANAAGAIVEFGQKMQTGEDEFSRFKAESLGGTISELERLQDQLDEMEKKRKEQSVVEVATPQEKALQREIEMLKARRDLLEQNLRQEAKSDISANRGGAFFSQESGGDGGGDDEGRSPVLLGRVGRRGRGQSSYLQSLRQIQNESEKAREQARKTGDTFIEVQNNIHDNQIEVNQTFERTGEIVADSFRAATREGATLRGVVQGLLRDLAAMQVNKAANNIGQSLTNALSASFGTGAGSSMATGTGSSPAMAAGRAAGGPVRQNETYMVGENGPELFTPGKSGGITPNDKMGGGVTYNIDARGADQAAIARLERTIKAVNGSIERRAVNAVGSQRQRSFRG